MGIVSDMFGAIFSFYTLWWMMLIVYLVSCVGLVMIVLLQKGKGAGFAGAFGIGAGADAAFGPRGAQSLPVKLTHGMAIVYMTLAFLMALIGGLSVKSIAPSAVEATTSSASTDTEFNKQFEALDQAGLGASTGTADASSSAQTPGVTPATATEPASTEPSAEPASATTEASPSTEAPAAAAESTATEPGAEPAPTTNGDPEPGAATETAPASS